MKGKWMFTLMLTVGLGFGFSQAWAQFPKNPTWTTVFVPPAPIEGLTGDNDGNFYVADRGSGGVDCAVWQIDTNTNMVQQVGLITGDCGPSGLAFDTNGDLFITSAAGIYKLTPTVGVPPEAIAALPSITGVPGNNGVAFDEHGDLYISDGTNNQGIVWKVTDLPANCSTNDNCVELFRVPPRRNGIDLGGMVATEDQEDGVGSVRFTAPRFDVCFPTPADDDADCLSAQNDKQDIVANGLAFNRRGDLYVADTSRGAIWKVEFDSNGNIKNNQTGCDKTFALNTLCWDNLWIADPRLEGIDGIALDLLGNIWASVNERNAIVVVTSLLKRVTEIFQNPPDGTTLLRNGNGDTDPVVGRPMEFPTSPFLSGRKFCTSGADSPRRDNNPNGPGEGSKVTCMVENLTIPGLPLPVQ